MLSPDGNRSLDISHEDPVPSDIPLQASGDSVNTSLPDIESSQPMNESVESTQTNILALSPLITPAFLLRFIASHYHLLMLHVTVPM